MTPSVMGLWGVGVELCSEIPRIDKKITFPFRVKDVETEAE